MIIKKIILQGYKRFFLSNIERLEYTPEQVIQIIASRNLSGKSSLLKQLSPLPADVKKDFKEGGFKYIEIEHLGNIFKLTSDTKHSFVLNDKELNPSGIKKIQLELVKEYFNITPEIMNVLYNVDSFTAMAPNERKHWFTKMSNVDYVFPVSVYNKLRQKHRDLIGAIKFTQENIIKTKLNIINESELLKLKEHKKNLEQLLDHVQKLITPGFMGVSLFSSYNRNNKINNNNLYIYNNKLLIYINNNINYYINKLYNKYNIINIIYFILLSNLYIYYNKEINKEKYININKFILIYKKKVDKEMNFYESKKIHFDKNKIDISEYVLQEIKQNKSLTNVYESKINKLKQELDSLDKIKGSNSLEQELKNLEDLKSKQDKLKQTVYIDNNESWIKLYDEYSSISPELIAYCSNLSNYDDIRFLDKMEIIKTLENYNELCLKISSKTNRLISLKQELEQLRLQKTDKNKITCSNCQNTWYLNYSPVKEQEYLKDIKVLEEELESLKSKESKENKIITRIKELEELTSNFKLLVKSRPTLLPIWKYLFNLFNYRSLKIAAFMSELNKLILHLDNWRELDNLSRDIKLIEDNLDNIRKIDEVNTKSKQDIINTLTNELEQAINFKTDIEEYVDSLEELKVILDDLKANYDEITKSLLEDRKLLKQETENIRNDYLLKLVDYLKQEIIDLTSRINDNQNIIDNLDKSNKLLEEYKQREKVLNIACKVLSPDEGLIAKSINSFITVIVEEMNKVINSIWTYDLEILPCEVSETSDLDYKFKVRINNDQIVEDISKLSSSGKEIVDLAFRLVLAKYLGVDAPLYLDEFGSTFDKAHRASAYNVIDKIMSSDYKQIFIVCHYESIYSSFKNVDFNVLDSNNIDLDPSIETNSVLKIVRG